MVCGLALALATGNDVISLLRMPATQQKFPFSCHCRRSLVPMFHYLGAVTPAPNCTNGLDNHSGFRHTLARSTVCRQRESSSDF